MKRIFLLILSLILIMTVFTSCSKNTKTETVPGEKDEEGISKTPGVDGQEIPCEKLKVGIIYKNDPGANEDAAIHRTALFHAADTLGIKRENISEEIVGFAKDTDFMKAVTRLKNKKCVVIFTTDRCYMGYCVKAADSYPNILFINFDGFMTNNGNFMNHNIKQYQASYVCGVIAAYKTLRDGGEFIGYVTGGTAPAECANTNAFALGVQAVSKDITVIVRVVPEEADPEAEAEAVSALAEKGCTVIGGETGNHDYLKSAADAGIYATACGNCGYYPFGCERPEYETENAIAVQPGEETVAVSDGNGTGDEAVADVEGTEDGQEKVEQVNYDDIIPEYLLARSVTDPEIYYQGTLALILAGAFPAVRNEIAGFAEGETSVLTASEDRIGTAAKTAADTVVSMLVSGEWDVFKGTLLTFDSETGALIESEKDTGEDAGGEDGEDTGEETDGTEEQQGPVYDDGYLSEIINEYIAGIVIDG